MRAGTVGEVIHHSLNEDGYIATYDVKWEDGTIEKNVPASLVEKMNSEMHEHETDDEPKEDMPGFEGTWDRLAGLTNKPDDDMDENKIDPEKVQQAGQFIDNLADEINIDVRKVGGLEWEDVNHGDHPDYSDAFISAAQYEYAPGKFRDLETHELEWVQDNHPDWAYEQLQDTLH